VEEIKRDIAFLKKKQTQLLDDVKEAVKIAMSQVLSEMKHDIAPKLKQETASAVFEMKNEVLQKIADFTLENTRNINRLEINLKSEIGIAAMRGEQEMKRTVEQEIRQVANDSADIKEVVSPFRTLCEALGFNQKPKEE